MIVSNASELTAALTGATEREILIRGGVYAVGDITCALIGTAESPFVFKNYGNEQVVIQPTSAYRVVLISGRYIQFKGNMIFDGTGCQSETIKISDEADNIVMQGLEVRNCPSHGFLVTRCQNVLIEDCNIHHNGAGSGKFGHAIYISVPNVTVRGCHIYNNTNHGVHAYSGTGNSVIEKNYLYDNGVGIGVYYGNATVRNNILRRHKNQILARYDIQRALIAGNTILEPAGTWTAGIYVANLYQPAALIEIYNNVIIKGHAYAVILTTAPNFLDARTVINNNLMFANTGNIVTSQFFTPYTEANNIYKSFEPVIDDLGDNIIPQQLNPAIGKGIEIPDFVDDYGGNLRNNPPTIGAWEPVQNQGCATAILRKARAWYAV